MQAFISHSTATPRPQSLTHSFRASLKQQLIAFADRLCRPFTTTQNTVQIRKREQHGVTLWIVCDRLTAERQELTSEAAVQAWLEQRYR